MKKEIKMNRMGVVEDRCMRKFYEIVMGIFKLILNQWKFLDFIKIFKEIIKIIKKLFKILKFKKKVLKFMDLKFL